MSIMKDFYEKNIQYEELFYDALSSLIEKNGGSIEAALDDCNISSKELRDRIKEEFNWDDEKEDEEELTEEDYEDQFDSEIAIRICKANNLPLSDIEEYGSEVYWINDGINNLQDLYDINENYVIPTGDKQLIEDYRKEILEEDE